MTTTIINKDGSNPDQIYFDIQVTNAQSTTTNPPIFTINETRSNPFINNPSDYYMSIVRFSLQTGTLPLFIPAIQPQQGNRDLTIYSITLEYENVGAGIPLTTHQQFLTWIPQSTNVVIPAPPSLTTNGLQNNQTGYYNCYNYQWFLYQVLQTFVDAFTALNTATGNYLVGTLNAVHPIITWNTTTDTATIYCDPNYTTNALTPYIKIYFNAPLFQLFNSFVAEDLGYVGVTQGRNFELIIGDFTGTNSTNLPYSPTPLIIYTAVYQEYSTISDWSPITSIVFVSNTLPIIASEQSNPILYGGNQFTSNGVSPNAQTLNIITDLIGDDLQYKPYLVYTPNGTNRYITLTGNTPLVNLDIQVYYKLKTGELIPFRIGSGSTGTLKILFIKKSNNFG